jgi:thiosulfate/3-mercaptopyruvate sulfurtransferase
MRARRSAIAANPSRSTLLPGASGRAQSQQQRQPLAGRSFQAARRTAEDFLALLGGRQPGEVVNYCGSGVSASHNALAMEVAGLTGSRLYAGSWSEWIADPGRPQEKG